MREVDGTEYVSRGCYEKEEHKLLMCNRESQNTNQHKKRNVRELSGGAQFSVECCQADLCNVGPYPKLDDYYTTGKIKICLSNIYYLK